MARISGEVFIRRPAEEIFDFVADERNNYDPGIRHTELLTEEPIGVGTRFRCESVSMGRAAEMVVEITEHERPKRFASSTHLASMDIHSTLVFEPADGGTLMRWSSSLEPHGLLKLLAPLLAAAGKRQTSAIWTNLKRTLET
ncbi:MAG: SRPBCC family protein [Bacillota bacterium]